MKKWSLNKKIFLILSIFILASVVISYMGLTQMAKIKGGITNIVEGPVAQRIYANRLNTFYGNQQISVRNIILAVSPAEKEERRNVYYEGHDKIVKAISDAMNLADEKGKKDLETFSKVYLSWHEKNRPIIAFGMEGRTSEAVQGLIANSELRSQIEQLLDQEIKRTVAETAAFIAEADQDFLSAKIMMLTTTVLSIFTGLILSFLILKTLSTNIGLIIGELLSNTEHVTGASQKIAGSSVQLSDASTEQASALEQTAASIQEMNSMVQKNAENAKRTSELAESSNENAIRGKEVVASMIHSIDEISSSNGAIMNQINESNQKISDIVKVISEIGNKTKVINDIVFQTKLLSFNASVEAARAGEHGKGFAVVAEEVGNLAQMSGNAAQEISAMLDGSIQRVEGIVNETQEKVTRLIRDGKQKVEDGSRIAKDCGQVLDEIVHNFSSVSNMANEITTACIEQSQGVQEITKAMNQLDHTTQNNAINSQETAASAKLLSDQAEVLNKIVNTLRKTIKGDDGEETIKVSEAPKKVTISAHAAKVLPMKKIPKAKEATASVAVPAKKAVGGLEQIPNENDSRFEEA